MRASASAKILLVQAIESVDEEGVLLSFEARNEANSALEGERSGPPQRAYAERARRLLSRLNHRGQWLVQAMTATLKVPHALSGLAVLLALFVGAGVQTLEGAHHFHILSTPLCLLIAWNLLSLCFMIALSLRSRMMELEGGDDRQWPLEGARPQAHSLLTRLLFWMYQQGLKRKWMGHDTAKDAESASVAQQAFSVFWQKWAPFAQPLFIAQGARLLHLCAFTVAMSALCAAYLKGLTTSYEATAASTFLTPEQTVSLARLILSPSLLFFDALPTSALSQLKEGAIIGPAAPWIHHYSLTITLLILLPRGVLTLWSWVRSVQLSGRLPLPLQALSHIPTLNVALAAHTNVGKTSLARTLLRRDVGEVRDAEHVTRVRAGYFLIHTEGERLRLWDTPGFGDSEALIGDLKRKRGWTRLRSLRDERLQFDREAALALREEADLILYLVPAHADEETLKSLHHEWALLSLIGTPTLCVLNRVEEHHTFKIEALLSKWRALLKDYPIFRGTLSLDAFSRSIEDELKLFTAMSEAVSSELRPLAQKLSARWHDQYIHRQAQVSQRIASAIDALNQDRELDRSSRSIELLRDRAIVIIESAEGDILELIGLESDLKAQALEISNALLRSVIPDRGERALGAIVGGALSGLISGVITDVLAGGLTFFGGAAVGLVVGALGGVGVAEGYRKVKGREGKLLIWDEAFIKGVTFRLLLIYLTASSFGRARGRFNDLAIGASANMVPHLSEDPDEQSDSAPSAALSAAEHAMASHWTAIWRQLETQRELGGGLQWRSPLSHVQRSLIESPSSLERDQTIDLIYSLSAQLCDTARVRYREEHS